MAKQLPFDLKKFKHESSDKGSTTLRHQDGHTMTILHKPLSKDMRAQLEALSKLSKESQTESQKQEAQDEEPQKMAKGGRATPELKGMEKEANDTSADPGVLLEKAKSFFQGDSKPAPSATPAPNSHTYKSAATGDEYPLAEGGPVMKYAEGTDEIQSPTADAIAAALAPSSTDIPGIPHPRGPDYLGDTVRALGLEKAAAQVAPEAQQMPVSVNPAGAQVLANRGSLGDAKEVADITAQAPSMQAPEAQAPQGLAQAAPAAHDPEGMLASGYNSRLQGINQQAEATGKLGEQEANILNKTIQNQTEAKAAYQQHYNDLESERQNFIKDIQQNHIDPQHYWQGDKDGKGGHSKILAGIGMVLAGFGPHNQPNAAIDYLKYQMNRDLEAQKENMGARKTLLEGNLRQFGNLRDATDMTRIMQHDIMANELSSAAATAKSPMAKAAALQAAGQLKMETAPMFQQFAMRRAMMGLANNGADPGAVDHMLGYMRVMNPEMAKEMESRYVPGVGLASVPLSNEVRDKLQAHTNLAHAIKDLQSFTKQHTNVLPGTSEYNTGVQKALELQQMIRHGLLNTVYREGEQPLLDKMIKGNPANLFKNFNTIPQLKELTRANSAQESTLRHSYGLPAAQQEASQDLVKGKDGRNYMQKTINGKNYMIPVGK